MYEITCPKCGHAGTTEEFEMSLSDECSCPKCEEFFEVDLSGEDEDDDSD